MKEKKSQKNQKPAPESKALTEKIEALESSLLQAQKELEKAQETKLRAVSDLENVRRRTAEEKIKWSGYAVGNFLKNFLPGFLELKIGAEHSEDEDLKKVIDKFFIQMENAGLQKIEPEKGESVDTQLHEVLISEEGEKGKIVRTLEPGWKFNDMVLRPAKVSAAQN